MSNDFKSASAILMERVRSFEQDGYVQRVRYITPSLAVLTLKHKYNGNVVQIKAYPDQNYFQQYLNGKIVIKHQKILAC